MAKRLRVVIGALGWTGHTYPGLALARELKARGHEVLVDAPERWRGVVRELGVDFFRAEDAISYVGLPTNGAGGPTLAEAARSRLPMLRDRRPDAVVSDVFTLAPGLAAELAGVRHVTLVPHLYPASEPGLPLFPLGLRPPRTSIGAAAWRAIGPLEPVLNGRIGRDRRNLNEVRAELGLPRLDRLHGAISDDLVLVATFPQLEYPRRWPSHVHVIGPMLFELPDHETALPSGEEPLVVVHSSTQQDPGLRLIEVALEALEQEPVRVVATMSRRGMKWERSVPPNARVVDWASYSQLLPQASLVVLCGGHGAVVRMLADGVPLLVCPPGADMAENGTRVAWAGAGLMLPRRLQGPAPLRWAVRRILGDGRFRADAGALAAWARTHDAPAAAAGLLERHLNGG